MPRGKLIAALSLLTRSKVEVRSGASCKIEEVREESSVSEAKAETAQRKNNRLKVKNIFRVKQKEKHRTEQLL